MPFVEALKEAFAKGNRSAASFNKVFQQPSDTALGSGIFFLAAETLL